VRKTRTLDVIAGHLPLAMSDGTVAAIFRLGGHPPPPSTRPMPSSAKAAEQNEASAP
jgi:hypothetical protein